MRRTMFTLAVLVAMLGSTLTSAWAQQISQSRTDGHLGRVLRTAQPIAERYIVVFRDTYVRGEEVDIHADELVRRYGGTIQTTWRHALRGFAVQMTEAQAQALAQDPRVAWVEEDGEVHPDTIQTLPSSGFLWGLDRIDQRDLPLDGKYDNFNADGSGVNVYVIDSGIRTTHTEFGGRAFGAFTSVKDGFGTNVDCNGHGTQMASIIGGKTFGVAKNVKLFAVRVYGCTTSMPGGFQSDLISGADWVTANHVLPAVVNWSLGGPSTPSNDATALDTAVLGLVASGVTFVASAGNANRDACLHAPTDKPGALTVGAVDMRDSRWIDATNPNVGSNFGPCVDLFAPGVAIASADYSSDTAISGGTGTSPAAAFVSGAAALYLSMFRTATPDQVATALVTNATTGVVTSAGTGSPNKLLYTGFIGFNLTGPPFNETVARCTTTLPLLDNTGFETGTLPPWSNPSTVSLIDKNASPAAHSGLYKASLKGGTRVGTLSTGFFFKDELWQTLQSTDKHPNLIPVDACAATLSFWLWIKASTPGGFLEDKLTVTVRSTSGGVLATLASYSGLDATSSYVEKRFDLTRFAGQTIRVQFSDVQSVGDTNFLIDDVTLNVLY